MQALAVINQFIVRGIELSSPILEALPALHVTIIGVVAAFFSAFAIYAYQKVNDAKEKLEDALKHSMSVSTPNTMMFNGNNIYVNEDGSLNWDNSGKEALRRATMLYSYLDYEEKYGIPRSSHQSEPSSEDVISACNELFSLFTTIFTTYPFWNNNLVHIEGQTDKVAKLCSKEFDAKRIQEMHRIVSYLNWTWNTNNRSLMTLASYAIEFTKQKQLKEQTEMFEKRMAEMPYQMDENEKQKIWKQFHLPRINKVTDFQGVFVSYFEKSHVVEKEVIPLLSVAISNFNTYNETFRVKETTLKVITLIMFNMLFGVLLPLVTLNLLVGVQFEWSNFWFSSFEYFVLFLTMFPYLWAGKFLFDKVKKLNFA
ncbi:hypothetical protein [Aliivibrio fischeri]|uniref:hypothetical protein n=1 Tax=Aliivibrio fischeri TaxID=668 RepID=UPI001F1F1829|nr:hypothetical protein [Aliivibrio fischeri]MCE4937470.1 hypothetical protein [Aliivibrio fischeri]